MTRALGRTGLYAAAALGAALAAGFAGAGLQTDETLGNIPPGWREIAWPFPRDAWPAGRAFRCASERCGGDVEVAIRPKIGFCNCTSGVADDDEVDRVSDLDMISEDFIPDEPGQHVEIAGMSGRIRLYTLRLPNGTRQPAVGLALSRRCDLVVAASQGPAAGSSAARRAVSDLLQSEPVASWISALLGQG